MLAIGSKCDGDPTRPASPFSILEDRLDAILCLSVCHSALIEDGKILAESDEDIAILDRLNHSGVQVKQHPSNPNILRVRVGDAECHDLEVVQKIPFSQETRKTVVLTQWNGAVTFG